MSAIPLRKTVHYPDSDGLPMADNDPQRKAMNNLIHALETRYAGDPDVYVSGNLFIYYVEGDPSASISPDAFVVFGVGKEDRDCYFVWEEGRLPSIVFEIASKKGWQSLLRKKKDSYERLGIAEYVVFDPKGKFIQPRFQGFRLENGRYRPIPLEPNGSLVSRTTGLRILPEGKNLRLIDAVTGERYLWTEEEAAARHALEEEIARLRAELDRRERNE